MYVCSFFRSGFFFSSFPVRVGKIDAVKLDTPGLEIQQEDYEIFLSIVVHGNGRYPLVFFRSHVRHDLDPHNRLPIVAVKYPERLTMFALVKDVRRTIAKRLFYECTPMGIVDLN